ncbi:hypothetical protein [Burkholderia sp. AU32262]|uniref:hypothetical protein n=1 Tax=Burkholderia sp. AU32262 TaxID=2879630 RepID=UPI0039A75CAD
MKIKRADQAWILDTTYIPMARGFVYLTAVVDWAIRQTGLSLGLSALACLSVSIGFWPIA